MTSRHLFGAVLALMQILAACSGGDGFGRHPPSIVSLSASPSVVQSSALVNVSLDFSDEDADVASIRVSVRDAGGALVLEDSGDVQGTGGQSTGTITGALDFTGAPVGTFTLEFTLVDARGNASAPHTAPLRIVPAFGPSASHPTPEPYTYLGATAVGDLDGDGRLDVAAIQGSNVTGKVLLYSQATTGLLGAAATLQTSILPRGVDVADVTGDARADLVLAGTSIDAVIGRLGRVVVYPQQADGTLGSPVEYVLPDDYGGPVEISDVDGDGRADVVTSHILFQDASGALDPSGATPLGALVEAHVADMNGDGANDLVFQTGLLELSVALQTSPRIFGAPTPYAVPTNYWGSFASFALGDLNGDGRADAVTVESGNGGYVNVLLQGTNGTLALQPHLDLGSDVPAGVEIADLDGDGLGDIAVDAATTVYVLYQTASHAFLPAIAYPLMTISFGGQSESRALSIADVTGDGKRDLVTTWSGEGVFVLARW